MIEILQSEKEHMVLEAEGSLSPRTTKTKGKEYTRYYIYIPTDLTKDSAFPFDLEKQPLNIKIDGDKLIVEKVKK